MNNSHISCVVVSPDGLRTRLPEHHFEGTLGEVLHDFDAFLGWLGCTRVEGTVVVFVAATSERKEGFEDGTA